MTTETPPFPPPAFSFSLMLGDGTDGGDISAVAHFSEASGIGADMGDERLAEGGENRFVHRLPGGTKHGNLVLKRGIAPIAGPLVQWAERILSGDLTQGTGASAMETHTVTLDLRDINGSALARWTFANSWPIKWSVAPFDSTGDNVVIESLELSYRTMTRQDLT